MLALFRGFLSTWAARAFFLLLVGSFVLWGVNDVVRNAGSDTAVTVIGHERIEPQQLQDAYRNAMNQFQRMRGRAPTEADQRQIAQITLEQLVQSALVANQAREAGIGAPTEPAGRQCSQSRSSRTRPGISIERSSRGSCCRTSSRSRGCWISCGSTCYTTSCWNPPAPE